MRKLLALALLATFSIATIPSFAGAPSFKQATSDYQSGKYQVALIEFEKFRESYPTNLQVHYYEALCYQGLNQLEKARTEFQYVIDNDEGALKSRAAAGLKQIDGAHMSSSGYSATKGAPPTFGRANEPGRLLWVLEFLDKDLCVKCSGFATHLFQASTKFQDIVFARILVDEGNDYRVPLYNPSKRHPWLVFLDGSAKPVILWQGILPNDATKIIAQIKKYRNNYARVSSPVESNSIGPSDAVRSQVQIQPPQSQTNPSSNIVNPYAPISPY